MSTFEIDFFELAFLAEACIPDKISNFKDLNWKYIPNYSNYIVNEYGDVISLSRNIVRSNGMKQKIHPKYLTPCIDKKGYYFIRLSNLGKTKSFKVHQLVAMAFLNHTPCGMDRIVDHIDENKTNNHYSNLQIVDNRFNVSKSIDKTKTSSKFTGVNYDKKRNKWRVNITIKNKNHFIGRFDSETKATESYVNKLKLINNE